MNSLGNYASEQFFMQKLQGKKNFQRLSGELWFMQRAQSGQNPHESEDPQNHICGNSLRVEWSLAKALVRVQFPLFAAFLTQSVQFSWCLVARDKKPHME